MKVLADFHHADLLHSLQLLFEDRLGMELYVPCGIEWWDNGYWNFGRWAYGDDRLAGQFLVNPERDRKDGVIFDPAHPERPIRCVTLMEFLDMDDWAFVVASVDDNQRGFKRLAGMKGAQYVLQVGNTNQYIDWSLDPLALVSAEAPIVGRGVRYHQEFHSGPHEEFGWSEPNSRACSRKMVMSFVNLMPLIDCAPVMKYYQAALQGFSWRVHGIECPDGILKPVDLIADRMATAGWGWHDKVTGDGFGHVIHNWAAIGRPLIGHASHYRGKMAEPFWQDLVTCIDLDRRSFDENVRLIRDISADPDRHAEMCRAIRAVFDATVDYPTETAAIAELLGVREAVAA